MTRTGATWHVVAAVQSAQRAKRLMDKVLPSEPLKDSRKFSGLRHLRFCVGNGEGHSPTQYLSGRSFKTPNKVPQSGVVKVEDEPQVPNKDLHNFPVLTFLQVSFLENEELVVVVRLLSPLPQP